MMLIPLLSLILAAAPAKKLDALYHSIDPRSVSQLAAFYHLYPDTPQGQLALKQLTLLMVPASAPLEWPSVNLQEVISLMTTPSSEGMELLSEESLSVVDSLAAHLPHRKLQGYKAHSLEELIPLPSEQIDLAHALLTAQFGEDKKSIKRYESLLDLMALQIAARLGPHPSIEEKVDQISHFIFHEMRYRFPPHSLYAKEIDLYTFLPSVIDNRKGVCLGVSVLYLCIGQRLDLPLEIITPPGHIFLRCQGTNIETTARGIHIHDENYLSINTRRLYKRTLKEVVGMVFFNQASLSWQSQNYQIGADLYQKAAPFMEGDFNLNFFMGLNALFCGQIEKGKNLLSQIVHRLPDEMVYPDSIPEDFLSGRVDVEGLQAIFLPVNETRESILKKQNALKATTKRHPKFRAGWFHLAVTHLQLSSSREALAALKRYHELDPADPTAEYYLAELSLERFHYEDAWKHLTCAIETTANRNHYPVALRELRHRLRERYPKGPL